VQRVPVLMLQGLRLMHLQGCLPVLHSDTGTVMREHTLEHQHHVTRGCIMHEGAWRSTSADATHDQDGRPHNTQAPCTRGRLLPRQAQRADTPPPCNCTANRHRDTHTRSLDAPLSLWHVLRAWPPPSPLLLP
jgi:hypothetical protein